VDCNCGQLFRRTAELGLNEELIDVDSEPANSSKTRELTMRFFSYILMQLAPGTAKTAAERISKIEGVKMAHAVTGPFDVIAFAEVPDLTSLSDLVLAKIQNIEGVQKTQTAVVVTRDALGPNKSSSRIYKRPTPPKEWVQETVRSFVRSNPGIARSSSDLLKRVREEAKKNNYRPIIAPAQVQAIVRKTADRE
jgi:DNA-binding Lrp family transcriptional regulator